MGDVELQVMGDHDGSSTSSSDPDSLDSEAPANFKPPPPPARVEGGVSLGWKDIEYIVPETRDALGGLIKRATGRDRTLLNKVNGCVPAGQCVAVMGPSGCGKSTMLDTLACRIKGDGLTGDILVNGQTIPRQAMKRYTAYVMQDDALHGVLTVRENLYYSAMLRLPASMSKAEKLERVEEVILELGLTRCADTKIGNVFFRGISGGERRRCSIGMELITQPKILLLDEPTSGLDAKSARLITETLVELARKGRTVVATIHQPSSQVFNLFDVVCLLSKGEQVFFGPIPDCIEFFEEHGSPMEGLMNPADHFLETINYDFEEGGQKPPHVERLIHAFDKSSTKKHLLHCIQHEEESGGGVDTSQKKYDTSFFRQLWFLCDRTFWTFLRDPGIFWARVIMYSMMAIMMGTLYLRMDYAQDTIQDRISVLFFSVAFLCFMAIAALPAFLGEREIFIRERRNAYYSVAPYAIAHTLVGIPFVFMIAIIFSSISYWLMNMNSEVEAFFYFLVVLGVALINSEGLVTAVSAVVPSFIVGIAMGAGLFGMYMLVCGFFLRADNIPWWWKWMHYLVFHKYAFEGFMDNEFSGVEFKCSGSGTSCFCSYPPSDTDPCVIPGENILEEFEYEDVEKWAWFGVLVGMASFYSFVFYLLLRFCNKGER